MARTKLTRKTDSAPPKRSIRGKKSPPKSSHSKLLGKDLERAVEQFQAEPDEEKAHQQWKKIEASVFNVQFED